MSGATRWRMRVVLAIAAVGVGLFPTSSTTLARLTDPATSLATFATDTLDPPTALAATGGTGVALSWAITPDTYATGYGVYRATTSGGTPSLVATVTPRTATATTDSPGAGTWYYVLRSQFQSWTSVASNQASATVGSSTTTAFVPCVSQAADTATAGDDNGYERDPARACVDDSSAAVDGSSGSGGSASCGTLAVPDVTKDRHQFWGFVTGTPATVTGIDGIQVRADLSLNNNGGTTNLCAQLSGDGGLTWTSLKTLAVTDRNETTYTFGSATDLWGRTWTPAQLGTTQFRVRLVDASTMGNKDFELDYVAVSVTYRP
jgi:hypothetical protein